MNPQERFAAQEIVRALRAHRTAAFETWRRNPTQRNAHAYDHAAQAHALALATFHSGGNPANQTTEERTAQ